MFKLRYILAKHILHTILFAQLFTMYLAQAAQGPGLGNLNYNPSELFTQISIPVVDDTTGILPPDYPNRKHFGVNVMTMLNGYMIGVFAPDSGGGPGGWIALDVSNPRNLNLVKTIYEPDTFNSNRTGNGLRTIDFREPHSFGLSENSHIAIQTGRGIEIWDWSDVNNPVQVSKLAIPGVNFGDYNNVSWQLFWQAPYLYVARGNAGLTIVNTSDLTNPSIVKTVSTSELGGFNIGPVFVLGNQLFVSSMETTAGFSILNISDPTNPILEKSIQSLPGNYYASCWDGVYAYFGGRSPTIPLRAYDTTTNPMQLVNGSISGFSNLYCNGQDDKLFLGNQDEIVAIDVSSSQNFSVLGSGSLNAVSSDVDHGQVFPFGNLVWVGNDHGSGSGLIAHQTLPDTAPPEIVVTNPAANATDQPVTSRIGIALSDSILMESVNSSTFAVIETATNTQIAGNYSVNLGFVNFTPSVPLVDDATYEVILDGIQDFAGNSLPNSNFFFSTGSSINHQIDISPRSNALTLETVTFSANAAPISTGGVVEYSWDFGDGSTTTPFSQSSTALHAYSQPGHWNVIVTVRENNIITTKSIIQTVHNPVTSSTPTTVSTIVASDSMVVAVNEDANTVTAIQKSAPFSKIWESGVGKQPRSLAIAPNGEIWVVNQQSDDISILDPNGNLLTSVQLPRGSQAFGIVFAPDGCCALVSLQGTGALLKIDPASRLQTGMIQVGMSARGIAVDSQSQIAYVTRFISPQTHAEVISVDIASMLVNNVIQLQKDVTTIDGSDRSRGIPNYLNSITISPDGLKAWIASNKANVERGVFNDNNPVNALTFETTIRAIASQIDLGMQAEIPSMQMDIDNRAQPKAIIFSDVGDYVYIALEGQNSIEIRDAYNNQRVSEVSQTGLAPRGLVKSNNHLFVHNFLSRTISIFDVTQVEVPNGTREITQAGFTELVANEALHPRVLKGKQIFYNASDPRMTRDGYISCASCHTDGDTDNRVWDFTDRGEGLRNTIQLLGRTGLGHGRVHWTANFDEIQDFENDIRSGFGGVGFLSDNQFEQTQAPLGNPKAGLNNDLDNLAFYVGSLNKFPKSPYRESNGVLTPEAQLGKNLFSSQGCDGCHSGDLFTDLTRHDVGTIQASSGQSNGQSLSGIGIDTPTLIGIWQTAPYFHNGQAQTLDDVLLTGTEHFVSNEADRNNLIAYLNQIEYEGPEIIVPDPPAESSYVYLSDLDEESSTNGWGPFEKDRSNGEQGTSDGNVISIAGEQFLKGLGVHAYSEIAYQFNAGQYDQLLATIGVDDETSNRGSVRFQVLIDNVISYQSVIISGGENGVAISVDIPLTATEIKLIVDNAGDGDAYDHADWADAKLRVHVPDEPVNTSPVVSAGADQTVNLTDAVILNGSITDDGLPNPPSNVVASWSLVSGPGGVSFADSSAQVTSATFSVSGQYTLRLTATDTELTASDDMIVMVQGSISGSAWCLRLKALSEINANPWASVAEIGLVDQSGQLIDQSSWSIHSVSSEELDGENAPAISAIDGNPNSFWHSKWFQQTAQPPHILEINLGDSHSLAQLRYLPRQDGNVNGTIKDHQIYISQQSDCSNWQLVASGTWSSDTNEKIADLDTASGNNEPPVTTNPGNQTNQEGDNGISLVISVSDPDSDPLTYDAAGLPEGLSINTSTGVISGNLDFDSAGVYNVTISVDDGNGGADSANFTWTVNNVNRAPGFDTLIGDQANDEGDSINLSASAMDPDTGDSLTYSATNLPDGVSINTGTGVITGTLSAVSAGSYNVDVTVSDDNSTDGQSFVWTVNDVNQPPSITNPGNQVNQLSDTVSLTVVASDPDSGDVLTFSESGLPDGLNIDSNTGEISGIFVAANVFNVTITVDDGNGGMDDASFTWTVNDSGNVQETIYVSSTSGGTVGGVSFADEDILAFDVAAETWSMYIDGSDIGLSDSGSRDMNAFTILADDSIVFSVVGATTLPDVGSVDDSDLIRFIPTSTGTTAAGTFEFYFDGSDVGLSSNGEDIDGVNILANGNILISTLGGHRVTGASGSDEDLLLFTPTTLGVDTSGTWSAYFDGSDVGLGGVSTEDVYAAWVDDVTGDIYLSTRGAFSVTGLSGNGSDIFICTPTSLGTSTSCSYTLFWDGSAFGYGSEIMDGLFIQR